MDKQKQTKATLTECSGCFYKGNSGCADVVTAYVLEQKAKEASGG